MNESSVRSKLHAFKKYRHTPPTLIASIKIQRIGPLKVSIFLRPVLLEEAKGIHKWQAMHKLCLYHVSFALCKWR